MKINVTIEIDDEELKELFNLKSEEESNRLGIKERSFSTYARFFDDSCLGWVENSEHNLRFLKEKQEYFNSLLKSRGHLFLNEVYDSLGIPRTRSGVITGWVYDEENPIGDNFVDFGLMNECNSGFINGYDNTAILDFNVAGDILSYI